MLRRAAIGETGDGNAGRDLLLEAVEIAEDERRWIALVVAVLDQPGLRN